jgi:Zn-dependent peptidase ImmA (M78 family)
MNNALLIDLADARSPEALLSVILRHYPHWTGAVPLEELCRAVNISDIRASQTEAFEGALVTDGDKKEGVILVRVGRSENRRRFTIAHELGHFLIPYHDPRQMCTAADLSESRRDTSHRRKESEANRFAAGLLMPKHKFEEDLQKLGDADIAHAQMLSDKYKVSLEATINRYADLTDDACAFVFARHGIVRYIRPSRDFPRVALRPGQPLPSQSLSAAPRAGALRVPSVWAENDGEMWLQTERGRRAPKLLEQTLHQQDGFQVTLLFLDGGEADPSEQSREMEWGG